jgi:hypothetical protein
LQGGLRNVDLIQAEKLATTVEYMTSGEPLNAARRRDIVATLRLLVAGARLGLKQT